MPHFEPDKQREFAVELVRQLRAASFEALWAGGCVRDMLLGRQPKDYDVATSAKPDEIRHLFGHRRTLPIGAAFGVITVLGPKQAGQIEVATFREDFEYEDGRRPTRVLFSSAEHDAQRRDFTINGLFYDPLAEEVIDYVDGQADLERGVIRAIGSAEERLQEDKLRALRAIRFCATFHFEIEPATFDAICAMCSEVRVVSAERIATEMRRLLAESGRAIGIRLLQATGLLRAILPATVSLEPDDAWQGMLETLRHLQQPTFPVSLAALIFPLSDVAGVRAVGSEWKLANVEIDRAVWLVKHATVLDQATSMQWKELQPILISPGVRELLCWGDARVAAGLGSVAPLDYCREKLALPAERLNPIPLIDGGDLKQCGVTPGPIFKEALQAVRDAQLQGEITSRDDALAWVRSRWPADGS